MSRSSAEAIAWGEEKLEVAKIADEIMDLLMVFKWGLIAMKEQGKTWEDCKHVKVDGKIHGEDWDFFNHRDYFPVQYVKSYDPNSYSDFDDIGINGCKLYKHRLSTYLRRIKKGEIVIELDFDSQDNPTVKKYSDHSHLNQY